MTLFMVWMLCSFSGAGYTVYWYHKTRDDDLLPLILASFMPVIGSMLVIIIVEHAARRHIDVERMKQSYMDNEFKSLFK